MPGAFNRRYCRPIHTCTRRISIFLYYSNPGILFPGIFYWFHDKGDKIFLAVVDCTGHGVPGALMSMIGNSLLNKIVLELGIEYPAEILERLQWS